MKRYEYGRLRQAVLSRLVTALVILVGSVSARTAGKQWQPSRIYDFQWYQKNQWNIAVTNYATFGNGIGRAGGEWPAGSGDMYIYGAGIWIGSLKKTETGKDTFVSNGYNPNSGKSEMTPGCYDNAPGGYGSRAFERVYISPDFPPNPADFPVSLQDSVLLPLKVNETTRTYFYYVPRTAVSTADGWAVFNDRDPANHTASRTPRPMGVEVYQSIYSWTLPWNKDIVFFKLDVRNRSSDTLRDVYLGVCCDADVGNAADDKAGLCLHKYIFNKDHSDSAYADNLGYVWSNDASPAGFIGFDFLQSPYVKNPDGSIDGFDGLDNNGNGLIDEPAEGRQVGMSAFKIFILANDPKDDFAQYLALAGYDWDPPYEKNPYDSFDTPPDDKRFLQATGPVTLAPGELTTVTVAVIGAQADRTGDPSTWPYYLAVASRAAQQAYDNNWIMPEPPPGPNVTAIPGDGRVTLVWDDFPEHAKDRFFPLAPTLKNPYYVEQDFQGYKVYRSRSGQPGDWALLAQFDKKDGLLFEDTTQVESLRTKARDRGLAYSFVDSSGLRLGFPYYYAVTAFDINYVGGRQDTSPPVPPDTLTLESGLAGVKAVPRTNPAHYQAPGADWVQVAGNSRLRLQVEPLALATHAVRADTFRIQFLAPGYDASGKRPLYRYLVTNHGGDTVVPVSEFGVQIDSVTDTVVVVATVFDSVVTSIQQKSDSTVDTTKGWLPVVQLTMRLKMDKVALQFFDHVAVVSGSYPEESLSVPALTGNRQLWAYRGSNYRLVWRTAAGGAMTCDVYDVDNDLVVPYRACPSNVPDSGDGWCFRTSAPSSADSLLVLNQTWYMFIAGSYFGFRPRGGAIKELPNAGDTWLVVTKNLAPAPSFAAFRVAFTPAGLGDTARVRVKVVPNPYLVRNEWERHPDFRKLKFINLPSHCTIRIYNLAGDLVKTIRHDATKPDVGGLPDQFGGDEDWDLLNEGRKRPAPGVYIFHVEPDEGDSQVGKFVLIY